MNSTMGVHTKMENWTAEEKKDIPPRYGCEIICERGTESQIKDTNVPNDAYIVTYKVQDKIYNDLCRGTRVKIFDLYYDKFGPGSLIKIDWGYGRINPKLWNYKSPNTEKKKRK